ncbi:MAG: hypothetical protein ACOZF2_12015 [Thermodesulfobacteriota bacterium]
MEKKEASNKGHYLGGHRLRLPDFAFMAPPEGGIRDELNLLVFINFCQYLTDIATSIKKSR